MSNSYYTISPLRDMHGAAFGKYGKPVQSPNTSSLPAYLAILSIHGSHPLREAALGMETLKPR